METISTQLDAHVNGEVTTLVTCVKIIQTKHQPLIANISNGNPGVVTTKWKHTFETGDTVKLRKIRGPSNLNRAEYLITRIDNLNFSIGVDTTLFDPYVSKGVAQKVLGYTEYFRDLTFENLRYQSTLAYMPNSTKLSADMSVDVIELLGILQNAAKVELNGGVITGISDEDLLAGRYSNAEVEIFRVNFMDLTMGRMNSISGRFGEATLHRGTYMFEFYSKTAFLQEMINEVYTNNCRADLGDDLDGYDPKTGDNLQQGFGCKVRLDPPVWKASTAYTVRPAGDAGLGSVVKPTVYMGRQFQRAVAGPSGLTEPIWNPTIGGLTDDNGVVGAWKTIEALTKQGVVYQAIDRRRWIDNDRDEAPIAGIGGASTLFPIIAVNKTAHRFTIAGLLAANFPINNRFTVVGSSQNVATYTVESVSESGGNTLIVVGEDIESNSVDGSIVGRLGSLVGFFTYGLVTFTSGRNLGISREVKTFSVTSADGVVFTGPGSFEMMEPFPFDIEAGDTYLAQAGCDKSLIQCRQKFDNINNRRAEDNIPGNDSMMMYPDAK